MKKKILTNNKVIEAWQRGERASNHRGTLQCYSDGTLFSYNLHIGQRMSSGACIVADYSSPGGEFRSITTSCHVGRAKRAPGAAVMHPAVWQQSPWSNIELPF